MTTHRIQAALLAAALLLPGAAALAQSAPPARAPLPAPPNAAADFSCQGVTETVAALDRRAEGAKLEGDAAELIRDARATNPIAQGAALASLARHVQLGRAGLPRDPALGLCLHVAAVERSNGFSAIPIADRYREDRKTEAALYFYGMGYAFARIFEASRPARLTGTPLSYTAYYQARHMAELERMPGNRAAPIFESGARRGREMLPENILRRAEQPRQEPPPR